jgi:magnesium-protoporphyrin O-methyltransferase
VLRDRLRPVHAPGGPGLTADGPGPDGPTERSNCGPGCACAANEFGERDARKDLRALRRDGPSRTTRWLIDALREGGVADWTVLDIGAGVGAVHLELLEAGAAEAVDVDASPAYVAAARDEAARRGSSSRVTYHVGDFVALARDVAAADAVVLDKVVCCYSDMVALVSLSAERARRRYGLVYPRDAWWIRSSARLMNLVTRLFRQRVTFHAHRTADVDGLVRAAGLEQRFLRTTVFWQVAVYERPI